MISAQLDVNQSHPWESALSEKGALLVHNHPPTVKFKATVIKLSGRERNSTGRLDGIDVYFSQVK
jgi:hypothetical protein